MSDNITDIDTWQANLYKILDLHDDAVRNLPKAEQDSVIRNAYDRLYEQHKTVCNGSSHEDCGIGLLYIFQVAYSILKNREKRTEYNNLLDYNHGFWRRWKVIMGTDVHRVRSRLTESLREDGIAAVQLVCETIRTVKRSKVSGRSDTVMKVIQDILRLANLFLKYFSTRKEEFIEFGFMALKEDVGGLLDLPDRGKVGGLAGLSSNQIRIMYISVGPWVSKMVVSYKFLGSRMTVTASGSGGSVALPRDCTNVRIYFEILRFPFVWCDLKRWNRFNEVWDEIAEPQVFEYAEPVGDRTFTIGGSLYFEKVLRVTDNNGRAVDDM